MKYIVVFLFNLSLLPTLAHAQKVNEPSNCNEVLQGALTDAQETDTALETLWRKRSPRSDGSFTWAEIDKTEIQSQMEKIRRRLSSTAPLAKLVEEVDFSESSSSSVRNSIDQLAHFSVFILAFLDHQQQIDYLQSLATVILEHGPRSRWVFFKGIIKQISNFEDPSNPDFREIKSQMPFHKLASTHFLLAQLGLYIIGNCLKDAYRDRSVVPSFLGRVYGWLNPLREKLLGDPNPFQINDRRVGYERFIDGIKDYLGTDRELRARFNLTEEGPLTFNDIAGVISIKKCSKKVTDCLDSYFTGIETLMDQLSVLILRGDETLELRDRVVFALLWIKMESLSDHFGPDARKIAAITWKNHSLSRRRDLKNICDGISILWDNSFSFEVAVVNLPIDPFSNAIGLAAEFQP